VAHAPTSPLHAPCVIGGEARQVNEVEGVGEPRMPSSDTRRCFRGGGDASAIPASSPWSAACNAESCALRSGLVSVSAMVWSLRCGGTAEKDEKWCQ
jgi:hypothetical protein